MGNVSISFCGLQIRLRTKQDHLERAVEVAHPSLLLSWLLTGSVASLGGMKVFFRRAVSLV